MAKRPSKEKKKSVGEQVAAQFIEIMKAGKLPPWASGFHRQYGFFPLSAISKKPYRGINTWILMGMGELKGYTDPRWLTFKQAKDRGGHIKGGEKSTGIVFWRMYTPSQEDDPLSLEEEDEPKPRFISRIYNVFNIEQTESVRLPEIKIIVAEHSPIEAAERVYNEMQNPPRIRFYPNGFEDTPSYTPKKDEIWIPSPQSYEKIERYYKTLFHEMGHSTGHETRLKRALHNYSSFTHNNEYAWEEVIAEMCAAMLTIHCGLPDEELIENSAAYIQHWIEILEENPNILISAGQEAQKAHDHILEKAKEPEDNNSGDGSN